MQNTIVKEFEEHPNVFAAVFQQGGAHGETREWLETFWDNYYLRGGVIYDENGDIGGSAYSQPSLGLPFGRGFIIDQEGRVALPYFGHQPEMAIAKIYELLGTSGARASGRPPVLDLRPAAPNPFTHRTAASFSLARPGSVRLEVYDPAGRYVRSLVGGWRQAGIHLAAWDGRTTSGAEAPCGVYFYRLEAAGQTRTRICVKVAGR